MRTANESVLCRTAGPGRAAARRLPVTRMSRWSRPPGATGPGRISIATADLFGIMGIAELEPLAEQTCGEFALSRRVC
jgi:hypothetical protein